jgi:hypothetical protein
MEYFMNVFYLDADPRKAAHMHLDKHVVKMIIEYAQLLSTAHRMLDGEMYLDKTKNGRSIKRWRLDDEREEILYKASHVNHPSAVWVRQSEQNYKWLYQLWYELCKEYTFRYGKEHLTFTKLKNVIGFPPKNIDNLNFTQPTPAMPDEYKYDGDSLKSYREYYKGAKKSFAKWTKREVPTWFNLAMQ